MENFVFDWQLGELGITPNEATWHQTRSQGESWYSNDRFDTNQGRTQSKEVLVKRGSCCPRINGRCMYPTNQTTYNRTNDALWDVNGLFTHYVAIKHPDSANMPINQLEQVLRAAIEDSDRFPHDSYIISTGRLGWRNNTDDFVIVKYNARAIGCATLSDTPSCACLFATLNTARGATALIDANSKHKKFTSAHA